jgi:hypothetical protein
VVRAHTARNRRLSPKSLPEKLPYYPGVVGFHAGEGARATHRRIIMRRACETA